MTKASLDSSHRVQLFFQMLGIIRLKGFWKFFICVKPYNPPEVNPIIAI
jgi:hypothetical protein